MRTQFTTTARSVLDSGNVKKGLKQAINLYYSGKGASSMAHWVFNDRSEVRQFLGSASYF